MTAAKVCRLREELTTQWCRDFPSTPPPVLSTIADLQHDDVIDESAASRHSSAVKDCLADVDDKITQLWGQIRRNLRLKQFFTRVLSVLDHPSEDSRYQNQLAVLDSQLTLVNKWAQGAQHCLPLSTHGPTCAQPAPGQLNKLKSFSCTQLHSPSQTHTTDNQRKSSGIPEKPKRQGISPSSASKFVSRITVVGSDCSTPTSPRSRSPTNSVISDTDQHHEVNTKGKITPDELDIKQLQTGDMFRKGKRSHGSKTEEESASRALGSKDNFLAVTSKHTVQSNVPHHAEGITNSPNLPRNFQFLKLTDDFNFVLDGGSEHDQQSKTQGSPKTRPDTGHTSHTANNACKSQDVGGTRTMQDDVSSDVTPALEVLGSCSTIQIRHRAIEIEEEEGGEFGAAVREAESDFSSEADRVERSSRPQPQVHSHSHKPLAGSKSSGSETTDKTPSEKPAQSFGQSLRGSSKGSIPPPVPKKPYRPSLGKKLPPIPVGVKPVLSPSDCRPGYSRDNQTDWKDQNQSQHHKNNTEELVLSEALETKLCVSETNCVHSKDNTASDSEGQVNSVNSGKQGRESQTLHSVTQVDRPESDSVRHSGSDSEVDTQVYQEVSTLEENNVDKSPVTSHRDSFNHTGEVGNSTSITEQTIPLVGDQHSEMSSYNFPQNFDRQRKRNSIGELVEGTKSSLVLVSKICEANTATPTGSESSNQQPSLPKNSPTGNIAHSRNSDVDDKRADNAMDVDFQRMTSSASSDTIVNELDRTESFSSDMEVKDAIYSLDNALKGESSGTLERSVQDPQVEFRTKRLSSTLNYENWTINRALTASLTQRELESTSDDDELDDSSSSLASPNLKRQGSATGSKDSGLCDDISMSDHSHSDDHQSARGLVKTQRAVPQPQDNVSKVNTRDSYGDETNRDMHNDLRRQESQDTDQEMGKRISQDGLSLDGESVISWGEEDNNTMDSSYDETDSAREGMLKMRELLVKGVLDTEKVYLDVLSVLINYKRSLEASSLSSQPVISRADIDTIFSDIETISDIQTEFVHSLQPKVANWHHGEEIGEIFKIMIFKFISLQHYLNNYQLAVSTINKCRQESSRFSEVVEHIPLKTKEVTSLEDALFKPVQRVQRNTLVLHDLIKYTPQDHKDYDHLQKALRLAQDVLEKFAIPKTTMTQENRRLVKSSFLVELMSGVRKLRYIFLFSDVLICTKRETHRGNKVTFNIKWYHPLNHVQVDTKFAYTDDTKFSKREEIQELKNKIKTLKKEIRAEMRKYDDKDKHRSLVSLGGATRVEKLRKKINQLEGQLILASPKLPFKVSTESNKTTTLLMSTEYEREEWKETIASLSKKCSWSETDQHSMSSIMVQDLINSVKETPQVNKIGSVLVDKDDDILTGILNVTIHKLNGLTEACDTYCCLEMDSFGHFFMKARTNINESSREPAWNADFELELEGSQTLRILCFKKESGNQGDTLLGRGALELSRSWLKGSFQEKTVSLNEVSLVISVRYTSVEKTMQRTPSRSGSAVFGVKLESCTRREGKTVPTIVTACVQEVEKRGLEEVGIYRVSGVTSDLQSIKRMFDKNVRAGAMALQDVDIHAVTGVLKLYLRELPEPLFTEMYYQSFIDALKLSDQEAKAQCMLTLLHELPDANYYTVVYLLEHLVKVARNVGVNKMSIHNLSTVFGPTLLAPATKQEPMDPIEMMYQGAQQVMNQSGVIDYLLGLVVSGKNLRRSAN